jgi:hypothetical protein
MLEQNRLLSVKLVLAATNGKKELLCRVKRLFVAAPQVHSSFFQKVKLVTVAFTLLAAIFFALPVLSKKTTAPKPIVVNTANAGPVFAALETSSHNNFTDSKVLTIINDEPAKIILPKKKLIAITKPEVAAAADEVEYNRALVNEDLLQSQEQLQDIAMQAADKTQEVANEMIVKIEEEQSGIKDKNTYVLQLKNNNGNAEIKPLILLNKKMKSLNEKLKTTVKQKIADSLRITVKTRITS